MPRGEGQLSHPMQSSGWTAGTSVRFCTNRAMTHLTRDEGNSPLPEPAKKADPELKIAGNLANVG
jgi:hypothetical protein